MNIYTLPQLWFGTVITFAVASRFGWLATIAIANRALTPPYRAR